MVLLWCAGQSKTHENMTLLGRRFLEKGSRSGSLLVFHWSMTDYGIQPRTQKTVKLPRAALSLQPRRIYMPRAKGSSEGERRSAVVSAVMSALGASSRRLARTAGGRKGSQAEEDRRASNSSSKQLQASVALHQRLHRS